MFSHETFLRVVRTGPQLAGKIDNPVAGSVRREKRPVFLEIALIVFLISINGFLAMSELAIVSARSTRLKVMAEAGSTGARTALALASNPGRFLSTVQIGITLVGILAGAFSGATIGQRLAVMLPEIGVPDAIAREVGVGLVVIVITYLSLIIGELVPKQIALAAPEKVAARVAPAMLILSRISAPLVWLLDHSGNLILRLIGQSGRGNTAISEEDIRMVLTEAAGAGVIHRAEKELIGGVMRFSDRRARGLMTPRHQVELAMENGSYEDTLARFAASGHSRLPVLRAVGEEIAGVLHSHDLLVAAREDFDVLALVRPVPVVQDTLSALEVVERLKTSPSHMVLVYDEYGQFEGIITPMDVLGTIAGGFDEDEAAGPELVRRDDGSMLVAGSMPADEFAEHLGTSLPPDGSFETAAGLFLQLSGEMPKEGQKARLDDWDIEIIDMDGLRIDKLLVVPLVNRNKGEEAGAGG